jgi:GDP-4-dehydro-6-deoxy-D-mannose reductase
VRVLITGITGFVGPHLAEYLLAHHREVEPWGLAWGDEGRDQLVGLEPGLRLVEGDLTDPASLDAALAAARPEVVFHLAAATSVADSWTHPAHIFRVNVNGQINLFECLLAAGMKPMVVLSSSAEIYGRAPTESLPLTEDHRLRPISPYGASKAAQDLVAFQYHAAHGLPTVRLRLFNQTGPRRPARFVLSSFARQITEIERGLRGPELAVGNLEVVRDFSDVRDVARAYWLAATEGRPGAAYNICSGQPRTIRSALEGLLELSPCQAEIRVEPALLRAAEIPVQYGSHAAFTADTGWQPEIRFEQTLQDLLDWHRGSLSC